MNDFARQASNELTIAYKFKFVWAPFLARFSHLLALPEGSNLGKALNDAMRDIEDIMGYCSKFPKCTVFRGARMASTERGIR